jgi:hypothetical protein
LSRTAIDHDAGPKNENGGSPAGLFDSHTRAPRGNAGIGDRPWILACKGSALVAPASRASVGVKARTNSAAELRSTIAGPS